MIKTMQGHEFPVIVFTLAQGLINGGVTTWALDLSKRLNSDGYSSMLLCHDSAGQETFGTGVRDDILQIPGRAAWDAGTSDIHSYLPSYTFDRPVIYLPNWSWGTWATVALISLHSFSDLRVIAVAHADEQHYYELLTYYEPIISKFIAVSDCIHQKLMTLLPDRSHDIVKLTCPVSVSDKPKYRDPGGPLTITYAGRLQQGQKRVLDIIRLANKLGTAGGAYHFNFAGIGDCRQRLERFFETTRHANLSANFLGLVNHDLMDDIWARSDVCILVSDFEGLSVSMLESMGHGCVPVVTNVSGSREAIQNEINGFIVDVGDMSTMAKYISDLYFNRALLDRVSLRAVATIRAHYTSSMYDVNFLNLARDAMEMPSSAWPSNKPIAPIGVLDREPLSVFLKRRALRKVCRILS